MDLFEDIIPNAQKSIFRFEGLQDYSGQDGNRIPPDPQESEWWQLIKKKNKVGVKTHRVRLVIEPQNDYTKMEVAFLRGAAEFSGEDIRIIGEDNLRKIIQNDLNDFYLVDDKYLFIMFYDETGKYIKSEMAEEEQVKKYIKYKDKLLSLSKMIK